MSVIGNIKTRYLIKHIDKVAPGLKREKRSICFKDVHSIGILLDGSKPDFIDFAKKYADELRLGGRSVELLAYVPKRKKNRSYTLPYFTKEDTNWHYKPNLPDVNNFMERPFDLLVNISPDKIMPLEYICALSASKFTIGNGTEHLNGYYDCLIKVNDSYSPRSFMENVRHYLTLQ
ncbi:MAG: hypothetical protein GY751_14260 [Bacteroidetes bacterium]|nr:hypothetical protein [Bacteroidota bacterium]